MVGVRSSRSSVEAWRECVILRWCGTFPLNPRHLLLTIARVHDALPHPADFQLAQRCLDGDASAIEELQRTYGPIVFVFVVHQGLAAREAQDLTDSLWTDCLAEREGAPPRLATYCGRAPLQAWLKTVALNQLLLLRREEEKRGEIHLEVEDGAIVSETPPSPPPREHTEAPLLALMCAAIGAAFQSCPAKDFVLLQLAHADRLRGEELGRMFGCSAATISRQLKEASKGIADATLAYIRGIDPLIDLKWDDFLELCRVASPSFLGVE